MRERYSLPACPHPEVGGQKGNPSLSEEEHVVQLGEAATQNVDSEEESEESDTGVSRRP